MDDANFNAVCNAFGLRPAPAVECGGLWVVEARMTRLRPDGVDYPIAIVRAREADANDAFREQVLLIARAQTPVMQAVLDDCRATADRIGAALVALAQS